MKKTRPKFIFQASLTIKAVFFQANSLPMPIWFRLVCEVCNSPYSQTVIWKHISAWVTYEYYFWASQNQKRERPLSHYWHRFITVCHRDFTRLITVSCFMNKNDLFWWINRPTIKKNKEKSRRPRPASEALTELQCKGTETWTFTYLQNSSINYVYTFLVQAGTHLCNVFVAVMSHSFHKIEFGDNWILSFYPFCLFIVAPGQSLILKTAYHF